VRRGELAIEQFGPAAPQRRDQPCQRDFRGIAGAAEHALAAEHPGKADAIEPADQHFGSVRTFLPGDGLPHLDRMGLAMAVQRAVAFGDAVADPAVLGLEAGRGAGIDHRVKGLVAGYAEAPAPQGARKAAGKVKPAQRQDRPHARLDPIDFGIVAAVRHRENPGAIGLEQQFRRDDRGFVSGHRG